MRNKHLFACVFAHSTRWRRISYTPPNDEWCTEAEQRRGNNRSS